MTVETTNTKRTNNIIEKIFKDFFLGCLAFLPLVVITLIFYYLFTTVQFLGNLLFGITRSVWSASAVVFFILILIIYTGRKLRRKEKWLLNFLEQWISKTPFIGGIYQAFRDMVGAFTSDGDSRAYLGTVKVPCGSGYIIGFVTKREIDSNDVATITVFVPTSPNPTSGLVFFFPEDKIEYLEMPPEKAFTKIISLGMRS